MHALLKVSIPPIQLHRYVTQVIWSKFQASPKLFFPCAVQVVSIQVNFSPYMANQVPSQLGFLLAKDPAVLHLVSGNCIEL